MYSNARQSIPTIFVEVMKNDDERAAIRAKKIVTAGDFKRFRELRKDKENLRRSADVFLRQQKAPPGGLSPF